MPKSTVVIDIETVGQAWESLPVEVQTYLLDRARNEAQREEVPHRLALHPATGRIVTIGLWYLEDDRGRVVAEGEPAPWAEFGERAKILYGSEAAVLREFWSLVVETAGTIVTFNGRGFDGPYLMIRSAILGVEPGRNLLPYRYSFQEHCDLTEVLHFWNPRGTPGTLDFWCRQFGIPSPKAGVQGADVDALYREGRREEIARYCLRDARATAQLYLRLRPIIRLLESRGQRPPAP